MSEQQGGVIADSDLQRHRVYMAYPPLADSLPQSLERRPIDAAARPAPIVEVLANPIAFAIAESTYAVEARLKLEFAGRESFAARE
ncbi:MAG: hypothetical protein ACK5Q4_08460 [Phycisphaerae bacterium]